jgi:Zn-dependent M28 family amino/carboxypeptidase
MEQQPLMDDLRALTSPAMQGRRIGTPGNAAARALLVKRFQDLGLQACGGSFEQPFRWAGRKGTNVVAHLPGTRQSPAILVSAHYDHLGLQGGALHPGADDNASGTAGVLQAAAWFQAHPPAHPMVFCLFDGEELGMFGSQAFVDDPPQPLTLDQIGVVVNMDMIAQGTQGRIFAGGTRYTTPFKPLLQAAFQGSKVKVVPDTETWDAQSDQYPFMRQGIPFIFFCVGDDDPYYHTPKDTFESIPQDFYWAATEGILETLVRLDAKTLPRQKAPRHFLRTPEDQQRPLPPLPRHFRADEAR